MGPTHDQTENANGTVHIVNHAGQQRPVVILDRRGEEAYIHYVNTDKRLDEWVPANTIQLVSAPTPPASSAGIKRKRSHSVDDSADQSTALDNSARSSTSPPRAPMDHLAESKEQDQEAVNEHQRITAKRNFEKVIFGAWQIKTWYYSPYPLAEDDVAPTSLTVGNGAGSHAPSPSANGPPSSSRRSHLHPDGPETGPVPGGPGTPILRIHGRTAELLASSGVGRTSSNEPTQLWVCDRCFKYMRDGISWELHMKKCDTRHPPGKKVYQRGAHTIWEVDGAEQKLYCQNLSLFGKLFIDVKTIFFDCDNFVYYILTDADSQRDHVLGFFSKEKISYDDWNLACIITFPPYQKKGYGMLLIEFSYELSLRAGKLGTPERPLSDLGLRSYLAYWVSVLVRFFRRILGTEPEDVTASPGHSRRSSLSRKKKLKGFEGEVNVEPDTNSNNGPSVAVVQEPTFGSIRTTHTETLPDGTSKTHLNIRCTLMDIARATGLRHEDVAFAMEDCGLLRRVKKEPNGKTKKRESVDPGEEVSNEGGEEDAVEGEIIYVSAEMVELVAKERRVKHKSILDPAHILL